MQALNNKKTMKELSKGNKIIEVIDDLKDNVQEYHPEAVGISLVELAKLINKKSKTVIRDVKHANIALNSRQLEAQTNRMRMDKFKKMALKDLLSGNQVDSMQGLDEEISNNSRQPLFQKSESENNSRNALAMNNNTGDLNTGFDDFNTGQLNSGIRATLANAGYSTEKQENALNFMNFEDYNQTMYGMDITGLNNDFSGMNMHLTGADESSEQENLPILGGLAFAQGNLQLKENLNFKQIRKQLSDFSRYEESTMNLNMSRIRQEVPEIEIIEINEMEENLRVNKLERRKLTAIQVYLEQIQPNQGMEETEDAGEQEGINFGNFGDFQANQLGDAGGVDFGAAGFGINGSGGFLDGDDDFDDELRQEINDEIGQAKQFEESGVASRVGNHVEEILVRAENAGKKKGGGSGGEVDGGFAGVVESLAGGEENKGLAFYHLMLRSAKFDLEMDQEFGDCGGGGVLPNIEITVKGRH